MFAPRLLLCVVWLSAGSSPAFAQDWPRANAEVRRIDPTAFPQLPTQIARYLHSRGCSIPQPYDAAHPTNAIRGHFISSARRDWAVLCSVDRVSTILVFRGGGTSTVDELAPREDLTSLQVVNVVDGKPIAGYERTISVATPRDIHRYGRNARMTVVDHEGIDDGTGKGSTILYWDKERWRELQGAN